VSLWQPKSLRRKQRIAWGFDAHRLAWHSAGDQSKAPNCAPHLDAITDALTQLPRGASVDVIAGNDIAVHWLQTPPSSASSLEELRLVASARCVHLFGGTPQDWWIAADWDAVQPFACAALPTTKVAPLQNRLAASGIQAQWYTNWGVACAAKRNTFSSEGWSALRSPSRLLLWHCRKGRLDCLAAQSISPDTEDQEAVAQALQQTKLETLRDPSLTDGPIHWVTLTVPAEGQNSEAHVALGLGALLKGVTP
jgi:hypothetical protein